MRALSHPFSRLMYAVALLLCVCCTNAVAQGIEQMLKTHSSLLSTGTGWAVSPRHILTNYHIVADLNDIRILTVAKREFQVRLAEFDKQYDLALLEIDENNTGLQPLTMAHHAPRLGTAVFTIGFPHPDVLGTSPKLTSGIINALNGIADDPRAYQISVPVQSGNSGGPLFNMNGEVVGVITSKLSAVKMFEYTGDIPQNVNYAVKADYIQNLLNQQRLKKYTTEHTATLAGNVNLETVADQVIQSIVLVAGSRQTLIQHNISSVIEQSPNPFSSLPEQRFVIYSYVEPGNYDYKARIEGSQSEQAFSKNVAEVLRSQISHVTKRDLNFNIISGKVAKPYLYHTEKRDRGKQLCEQHHANKIFVVISESNPGMDFRYATYSIFDCATQHYFKRKYQLERDSNDGFGYEDAFHSSFQQFINSVPERLNWARR